MLAFVFYCMFTAESDRICRSRVLRILEWQVFFDSQCINTVFVMRAINGGRRTFVIFMSYNVGRSVDNLWS